MTVRSCIVITCSALMLFAPLKAEASTYLLDCGKEDVIIPGWDGRLTVTYEGDATGTAHVASKTQDFSLPAHIEKNVSDVDGTSMNLINILADGNTKSKMPDLPQLEACIAKTIPSGKEQDEDVYRDTRDDCLGNIPINETPIDVRATIKVSFYDGGTGNENGLIVDLTRVYLTKTSGPGGMTRIDTLPATCVIKMN